MPNIKEELSKKLKFISETTTEYVFRCPYCGDSKNIKKGHMYVAKSTPVFRCARCGTSGHYSKLLGDMGLNITNIKLPNNTSAQNAPISRKANFNFSFGKGVEDYLKTRLGDAKIDPEVCRIVDTADLPFIYRNSPNANPNRTYPEHAVLFACWNGHKLVGRCFDSDEEKYGRYINYSLSVGKDCYVMDNKRDPVEFRSHKTIVIAEGIFDILNTYHNLNLFPEDSVFAAGLTSSLDTAFTIAKYISGCFTPKLIVLADNDMRDEKYLNDIKGDMQSITIFRNRLGKDFGDKRVMPAISYRKEFKK